MSGLLGRGLGGGWGFDGLVLVGDGEWACGEVGGVGREGEAWWWWG